MTGIDRLIAALIDQLESKNLKFPAVLCNSEGLFVLRSIVRALWHIDCHRDTLANASKRNVNIPVVPDMWDQFTEFTDYVAKKIKMPAHLPEKTLHENSGLLCGMLSKPVLRKREWQEYSRAVECLAVTMETYSEYLRKQNAAAQTR